MLLNVITYDYKTKTKTNYKDSENMILNISMNSMNKVLYDLFREIKLFDAINCEICLSDKERN